MTKIATATTAMRLHADGVLDLDAPIGDLPARLPATPTARPPHDPPAAHPHRRARQPAADPVGPARGPARGPGAAPADPGPARHPHEPGRAARGVLQHRLPPGRRGDRGRHRAAPSRTASGPVSWTRSAGRDRLPLPGQRRPEPSATCACPGCSPRLCGRCSPAGSSAPRADGYTALHPFLVNGAAYGGLVGTVTDAVTLAAAHPRRPRTRRRSCRTTTSRRCAPSRAPGSGSTTASAGSASRATPPRDPPFVEHYGTGGGFWNAMRIYPTDGSPWSR